MNEILLQAQRRQPGRSAARAMRRQSVVPGIFYFHGEEPIAVEAGDLVEIAESRPISKTKSWVVTRLVKKAVLA